MIDLDFMNALKILVRYIHKAMTRDVSEPRQNDNSYFFNGIILKRFYIINIIISYKIL